MKYIHPVVVTDAMLVSDSVPETDYAAWAAGTSYSVGDRVIRTSTHRIYQRLIAGTTATAPESDAINWVDIGPTNRWAMFDRAVGTVTSAPSSITITLDAGQVVEGLALLDLDCESVQVSATVGAVEVYSATYEPVLDTSPVIDWYSYFFTSIARRRTLVITDLPPFFDLVVTVTISTAAGTVSCGTLVLGRVYDVGQMTAGAQLGIVDYSAKTTDAFGVVTVTQRGYSNRMTCRTVIDASAIDQIAPRLAAIRATPVVWIGAKGIESTVIYGWVKDWGIDLALPTVYHTSLTIEGLV